MPTILYEQGFRFYFFAADGGEPPHVHVRRGRGHGKWWLDPVAKARARGFTAAETLAVERIVRARAGYLLGRWHDFFGTDA